MNLLKRISLFALILAASGCGTFTELSYPPSQGVRLYGGVKTDFEVAESTYYLTYVDVPFTAVGDTLVLPYSATVYFFGGDDDEAPEPEEKSDDSGDEDDVKVDD